METSTRSRWIRVTGATNVRDLGGYATADDTTRWGALFRSDSLHRLSEADQQMLIDNGVRTVIDLRHAAETEAQPNVFASSPHMRYLNLPVFRAMQPSADGNEMPDLAVIYRYMVDECQLGLGEVLAAIADADEGGVVFHCSAGKDRTGIVAALLLSTAGVPAETIAQDYALTTEAMMHLRPRLLEQVVQAGGDPAALDRLLSSEPDDMLSLLAYLQERYGSTAAYLRTLGLTDAQIERLRARLVVSA